MRVLANRHVGVLRVTLTLGACAAITAVVALPSPLHFAYSYGGAAVAVSAYASASAFAISVLFFARNRRAPNNPELLISFLFGVTAAMEAVLPLVEGLHGTTMPTVAFWSRLTGRMVVAAGICATAWMPLRLRPLRVTSRRLVLGVLLCAATIVLTTAARLATLPRVNQGEAPLTHELAIRGIRIAGVLLLLAAAVGFVRRARTDQFNAWVAVAAVGLACGRLHDFLYPTLRVDLLTTADLFRLAGQTVLVVAAVLELRDFWRRRTVEARKDERQRLAAELHDGLAQELAYLRMVAELAATDPGNGEHLERTRAAVECALAETRLAVAEFSRSEPVSLARVIEDVGRVIEARYGCTVVCDLDDVVVDATTAHELSRAAREALTNAARHAEANRILCRIDASDGFVHLEVSDDGNGITSTTFAGHFGLASMQSRAERLGGRCSIRSGPRLGTHVAIEVPAS
jgi:signal transduction histidine kinase